jgi:voltage-gated potassium channel
MITGKRVDSTTSSGGVNKIIRGLIMLGMVLAVGTLGYMILEGWHLLDAFYMTVITITTVGYGEIRKVDDVGRIFTVFLIFMGMGIMAYTLGMVAQTMVELQVKSLWGRKKLGSEIRLIRNHYILCGYGRMGKIVTQELKSKGIPLLVIDSDPELKRMLENIEVPYIIDDATSEDVLMEAGIERAKGLVSMVSSDADNLFITMTARGLNQTLFILVRTDEESTQKKLLRAGADRVVRPYLIGGRKMAQTIIRPSVTDFLEFTIHDKGMDLNMEELMVGKDSKLKGLTLVDSGIRQELDIIIVAIRKSDGKMGFNPSSQTLIESGDTLIAMGLTDDLDRLSAILASG